MEYLFQVIDPDGTNRWVTDPANPLRVPGAFGEKSVLEFSGYQPPAWLARPGPPGRRRELTIGSRSLDRQSPGHPVGARRTRRPDARSAAARARRARVRRAGRPHVVPREPGHGPVQLPPLRAALLGPGPPRRVVLGQRRLHPGPVPGGPPPAADERGHDVGGSGIGASLGALAMLHAHRRHAGAFDALFLQSGSSSTRAHDPQESAVRPLRPGRPQFVAQVLRAGAHPAPVPDGDDLRRPGGEPRQQPDHGRGRWPAQGYDVTLREVRDVHNYTAWRDALHPRLTELLNDRWPGAGCGVTSSTSPATAAAAGRRLRPLRPPGARVPVRAGPGLGLREQRHGRRGRGPDRRRPGQALLRRLAPTTPPGRTGRCRSRSGPAGTATTSAGSLDQVVPWIRRRTAAAGRRSPPLGCSLGAFHAAQLRAAARATCSRWRCACPATTTRPRWHAWGERGDATYFNNPIDYVANLHGDHLDWLRARLTSLLVVGQGAWEVAPDRRAAEHPRVRGAARRARASRTSWTCGGTTSRTTGRPGSARPRTTCRGWSER